MRSTRGILLAATLLAATATTAAAAEPEWIKQFGTVAGDFGFAVATGPDGRLHVAGGTAGRFFGVAQKGWLDAFIITFDRDGTELWRRQPGTAEVEYATAVATDADGNVYVVGYAEGALGGANKGVSDAFVVKFDRDGRAVWKRQPGTNGWDYAEGVASDADGNVYVVGYTGGALGGANKGYFDAFVVKFDRNGRYLWKRQPGTKGRDSAHAVATDADGNVYVVGGTEGPLGGPRKGGYSDAFVIKFDPNGGVLWSDQPGTSDSEVITSVASDADGNVYVVGYTGGALGGSRKGLPYQSDAFVIKYDRDGRTVWSDQPGTIWPGNTTVATDADGNVFMGGTATGALGGASKGGSDAFVIKYDRDGGLLWKDQQGTNARDLVDAVAIDADGNAYLVGQTESSLPGNTKLGDWDAFVIKYGPDGPQ